MRYVPPYFLQLSQNMATNCLFTFVFFPILTWVYMFCVENCSDHKNKTIFVTKQVNSVKNEGNKIKQTISCHVLAWLKKVWICLICIKLDFLERFFGAPVSCTCNFPFISIIWIVLALYALGSTVHIMVIWVIEL